MKQGSIYLSHGGGPLPILGDQSHQAMIDFMKDLPGKIGRPKAIIVISAHWEEPVVTITGGEHPELVYDYYGFPAMAYELKYPACGNPPLEKKLQDAFTANGIEAKTDNGRGFDHGVFIPLKMMYPDADIPVTQISLVKGLDPAVHIEMGRVIGSVLDDNTLLIGSGFSFHNMGAFDMSGSNISDARNNTFQNWLTDVCCGTLAKEETKRELADWEQKPNARYCHPREEHLLPLHVCFGASQGRGKIVFDDYILGKRALAVSW